MVGWKTDIDPNNFPKPALDPRVSLVMVSDLHEQWESVQIPRGDVLVVAGDITYKGSLTKVSQFNDWLARLKDEGVIKHAVVIAGNHDLTAQTESKYFRKRLKEAVYLNNQEEIVMGLKFFGSPWTPWFYDWAFNARRGKNINEHWELIPDDTDVLVTHGPPYGAGDLLVDGRRAGCVDLRNHVLHRVKPKVHVCGHLHHGYGIHMLGTTVVVNASTCTEQYEPTNLPIALTV